MSEFVQAIQDVQNALADVFNEAIKTHGPAATMSAVVGFTASAVHHGEHLMTNPQARQIVLGQFMSHFHAYLDALNQDCDAKFAKPEGEA